MRVVSSTLCPELFIHFHTTVHSHILSCLLSVLVLLIQSSCSLSSRLYQFHDNRPRTIAFNRTMSAATETPAMAESTVSLSLDNLRLSDGEDDNDVTRHRVNGDSRALNRTSHQSTPPASVWCSPRTVRQQPEVRLLLRELERARSRGEIYVHDPPIRVPSKVRPLSAVKLSSTGSSSRGGLNPAERRPATSLGHSTGSVPSTRTSASSADTSFDDSGQFSGSGSRSGSGSGSRRGRGRRRRGTRSPGSFCNRVLSTTLVKGEEWAASKYRQMTYDPVLEKVTVHIMNFRNPAEEVG